MKVLKTIVKSFSEKELTQITHVEIMDNYALPHTNIPIREEDRCFITPLVINGRMVISPDSKNIVKAIKIDYDSPFINYEGTVDKHKLQLKQIQLENKNWILRII